LRRGKRDGTIRSEERIESSKERERWNPSSQRKKRCGERWNIIAENGREVF
jgi:hypothetical protein